MDPIRTRARVVKVRDRVRDRCRYHIGRGAERVRALPRAFWHGLITGLLLPLVVFLLWILIKSPH